MIYLDFAATTPLDPRVFEAMKPFLLENFGNASSIHQYGQTCRRAIDDARNTVIKILGAFSAHEIIFTGSGTESCNMALFGAASARQDQGKHIIISAIEHPAVRETAHHLRNAFGFELTEVQPNKEGFILAEDIKKALRPDTVLASVMLANNEVGTIQPIKKTAKIVRDHGALMHTDACQSPGYIDLNVEDLGVDLLTLNGGKIYGPKGVGLLYIREGVKIMPHTLGGGQEFRMRAGTENTANIVGFAKALELLSDMDAEHIANLRDELLEGLLKLPEVSLNGSKDHRLQNNINIHVEGHSGESLVMRLDMAGLAASSGSACSSGKTEASHVLMAMGQSKEKALQSLRLSLGRPTTSEDIEKVLSTLSEILG